LVGNRADVNIYGGDYGAPFQTVLLGGYKKIVELLFKKRVDVNVQGGRLGSALQAASMNRHEQIVKLLVEKGAKVIKEREGERKACRVNG
jgi:ankyrin repeat protein